MKAIITVGLGFGDEGKGACVDFLARELSADLIVRYCGGAQAGHNVELPGGERHTFSQFGAGTLAGARSYLGSRVIISPATLVPEADHLRSLGVSDPWSRIAVHPECLVATTYHMDQFSSGFVEILAAEQTPESAAWFEGTADAVRKARRHFAAHHADYYLILAGDHLYRMNYSALLDAHIGQQADITIAAQPCTPYDATQMGIFVFDRGGQIVAFEEKPHAARLEEMKTSPLSLIPEDVEAQLTPQEIADLFAYLALDRPPGDPGAKLLPGAPKARAESR